MTPAPSVLKKAAMAAAALALGAAVVAGATFLWFYAASAPTRQRLDYTSIELQFHTRAWIQDLTAVELGRDGAVQAAGDESRLIAALVQRLAREQAQADWGTAMLLPGRAMAAVVKRWGRTGALAQAYLAGVPDPLQGATVPPALMQAATDLQHDSDALATAVAARRAGYANNFIIAYAIGFAALLMLALNAFYAHRAVQGRMAYSAAQNARFRAAMIQLRDALDALAQGRFPEAVAAPSGMDAIVLRFNEVVRHWRAVLGVVSAAAGEVANAAEAAKLRMAQITRAANTQIEHTTAASSTLHRVIPALQALAERVGAALPQAAPEPRDAGETVDAAPPPPAALAAMDADAQRLAEGLEHLSALVLHLVIRVHGSNGAQPQPAVPPYANQALQLTHHCTAAVKALQAQLAAVRGAADAAPADSGAAAAAAGTLNAAVPPEGRAAAGSDSDPVFTALAQALHEHSAGLVSVLDDMDALHGYTMELANGAAEVSRLIRHIADDIQRIGRDADNYNSNLPP